MKSAPFFKFSFAGLILILALHYGVGCWNDTTDPGPVTMPAPVDSAAVGTSATVSPAPEQPVEGSSAGAGTLQASPSSQTTETEWCALLTNDSGSDEWGTVACYEDPNRDVRTQTLFDHVTKRLRAGEELTLCARTPCDNWQCDAVNLRGLPPKENPEFGSNLLLGRIGRNAAASCKPPTTTTVPPVCVPEGEGDGYNCRWNSQLCEWECQTCEEANSPGVQGYVDNVTSSHITASFTGNNAGSWSLTLWAGSYGNPNRYRKRHDTGSARCGGSDELSVSFRHQGHGSCLWTIEATGPGIGPFSKVVLDRCQER